jgi:hypothetical protein
MKGNVTCSAKDFVLAAYHQAESGGVVSRRLFVALVYLGYGWNNTIIRYGDDDGLDGLRPSSPSRPPRQLSPCLAPIQDISNARDNTVPSFDSDSPCRHLIRSAPVSNGQLESSIC